MKTVRFVFVFAAFIAILLTACGGPAPTTEPVEPAVPAKPQYAPFCEASATSGCEAPTVTMIDPKYCVDKVPYVILSVPPGTTYKSSDSDMECIDEMHNDGNLRITCHSLSGKDNWSYDLELCNGACTAPALQMETGQCPEGYGYDSANMCCAEPVPASGDSCTTFTVDLHVCYGE